MKIHAVRLLPQQDLKKELLAWAKQHQIKAACVVTCVGSLKNLHLRLAEQKQGSRFLAHFEILSLAGTFSEGGGHFHLAAADESGKTLGGHLLEGNHIHTTAEIVILELPDYEFTRKLDAQTGYLELNVQKLKTT